jgi:transposase
LGEATMVPSRIREVVRAAAARVGTASNHGPSTRSRQPMWSYVQACAKPYWVSPRSVETSPLREMAMAETRRKFEQDFKEGAVRLVRETGKPIAQVARELGIHDATLGNWVNAERRRRGEGNSGLGEDERAELVRLRRENAELRMRCDVLKRSMALWVTDAVGGR